MVLSLLGCLSPDEIQISTWFGYYAAAFAIAVTLALLFLSWRQQNFKWLATAGVLLLLHPAWTISAFTGDCGYAKRLFAGAVSIVFIALLLCQGFRPETRIRSLLLVFCVASWAAYLVSWLIRLPPLAANLPEHGILSATAQSVVLASKILLRVATVSTLLAIILWVSATLARSRTSKERIS